MERIKKVFTWIHIILWTVFAMLVCLQLYTDRHPSGGILSIAFLATCLYAFYAHFYLLTLYLGKNKKGAYFLRFAFVFLTGSLPMTVLYYPNFSSWESLYENYMMHLITTVPMFLFLGWLARVTQNLVLYTIRKEQLEKQAVEAELFYLKAQINPHFLFNTLHNIHTLVYKQSAAAPEAVLRLSSLMRYMIYESNDHTVPISREMTYLQDYISLQQLRYKNSPVVDLSITGDTSGCFIAPLLFIHFLENAYKHSPARLEPGDIQVKVEIKENDLVFFIQNQVAVKQTNSFDIPGGVGLPNIRKRLSLLYPDRHTLEIKNHDNSYIVILTIRDLHKQVHERKANVLYN